MASAHILNRPIIVFNYFSWSQELRVGLVEEFSYVKVQEPVLEGLEGTQSDLGLGLGSVNQHGFPFLIHFITKLSESIHIQVRVHPYSILITMKGIKPN